MTRTSVNAVMAMIDIRNTSRKTGLDASLPAVDACTAVSTANG